MTKDIVKKTIEDILKMKFENNELLLTEKKELTEDEKTIMKSLMENEHITVLHGRSNLNNISYDAILFKLK